MSRHTSACMRLIVLALCLSGVASEVVATGPDPIVGDLIEGAQYGREGVIGSGTVGLGFGVSVCNKGDEPLHIFRLPDTDHGMYPMNMYRLKTEAGSDRMEQIGLSWVKHMLASAQLDQCGFGCQPFPDFTQMGPGCSDPYSSGQNATSCRLGPRSVVNPYTGEIPGGDELGTSADCSDWPSHPSRNHDGHDHDGISHRLQIRDIDLMARYNVNARYFAEAQVISPHEFAAGNGNQNNNVSHREFTVIGPSPNGWFFFDGVAETVTESPAFTAWPDVAQTLIEPLPLVDGRAFLAYKATDLGDGLWHYEYALYNMHLNGALGSLAIPIPSDVTVSDIDFHAPRNHAPELHAGNYGNVSWDVATTGGSVTWSTDPYSVNPLANAVRWGTMYNFRFDANAPPQAADATVGLFEQGTTVLAATVGPSAVGFQDCNNNSVDDRCDLDCDASGCAVPGCGLSADCTANGIPDECEADCDGDTIADRCELLGGLATDCNGNAVPDNCEPGGLLDCNANSLADFCDVLFKTSEDFNGNGIPDECDPHAGTIYVDDDAPGDPAPGDPTTSDPAEDGTLAHPFDAIQEAIDASLSSDVIVLADGTYTGVGNREMSYGGRTITVRSANGPDNCIVDLEHAARGFDFVNVESPDARLEGLTILNAIGDPLYFRNPAIYCVGSHPTIYDCVIAGCNVAAIQIQEFGAPIIDKCRILDNRFGVVTSGASVTLHSSLIKGSDTGIRVAYSASATIASCTVVGNATGFYLYRSDATVSNSIIWGNTDNLSGGANPIFSYSNVEGGVPGTGNIAVDPLLVDMAGGDFRLSPSSPSIDAGDSTNGCRVGDLDGSPRFLDDPNTPDTGTGGVPMIDMGAYEFVPQDCNDNGTPDADEILADPLLDGNGNGILDECEPSIVDCDADGIPDSCELDCNLNGVADDCDVLGGSSPDCNANGIPDECELDCQSNGIPDQCDIAVGVSVDCNGNGIPDECEADCQPSGVPDDCDIDSGSSQDCQLNGIPDECDIESGSSEDCQLNGIPDECEADCQPNGLPDECDIADGSSSDDNANGIPDECEILAPVAAAAPHDVGKNRYVSFDPNNAAFDTAFSIALSDGRTGWVGAPQSIDWGGVDSASVSLVVDAPVYRQWAEETIHLFGCVIVPDEVYEIRATLDGASFTAPLLLGTVPAPSAGSWADIVGGFDNLAMTWTPPNGFVNFNDIDAAVKKFQATPTAPHVTVVDLHPQWPNYVVNFSDIDMVIKGFQGVAYPVPVADCPTIANCPLGGAAACLP